MKKLVLALTLLSSVSAFAAGGFTWFGFAGVEAKIEHIFSFAMIASLIVLCGFLYRYKLSTVSNAIIPDKGITFRNIVEAYGQFIHDQCKAVIGEEETPKYYTFIATLFIVILLSNLLGLIPGFLPPTEHLSTTFALGCFVFIYYNYKGCKELGTINYLKHFAGPIWYMGILIFPIEILSNMIRPLSLALRLKGNMMGDHQVLAVFSGLGPYLVPIPFLMLGLLVSFIQAYVFTMLTMVYISLATAHHDHDDHH